MTKGKRKNEGFSLVELIIVIAIMAVLIATLAPLYISYVERTKKQSDLTAFSEAVEAMDMALISSSSMGTEQVDNVTLTWGGDAFTCNATGNFNEVYDEWLVSMGGTNGCVKKSKFAQGYEDLTVTWTISDNVNETWSKAISGQDADGEFKHAAGIF